MNERKLLLEMIRQARRDYTSTAHSRGLEHWMYRPKTDPFSLNWICDATSWNELMEVLDEYGISLCEFGPPRTEEEKKRDKGLSSLVKSWFAPTSERYGAPYVDHA